MLQTIYEGESSFSITEGRVGHQQFPDQSKMHNVNGSGDHTARCLSYFCSPPPAFQTPLFESAPTSLLSASSPAHIHSAPLSFAHTLRSAGLCMKSELRASAC